MERVGAVGDGGKWLCSLDALAARGAACVVYSYGVRDDVSFEAELAARTNCSVHLFDPSIAGMPAPPAGTPASVAARLHYHKVGW